MCVTTDQRVAPSATLQSVAVSTRALIVTALATGMVILVAFAVQVAIAL